MDLKKILPTDGPPVEEVLKYVEKYKNEIIVIKYGTHGPSAQWLGDAVRHQTFHS